MRRRQMPGIASGRPPLTTGGGSIRLARVATKVNQVGDRDLWLTLHLVPNFLQRVDKAIDPGFGQAFLVDVELDHQSPGVLGHMAGDRAVPAEFEISCPGLSTISVDIHVDQRANPASDAVSGASPLNRTVNRQPVGAQKRSTQGLNSISQVQALRGWRRMLR
jgi:hypothetical protein